MPKRIQMTRQRPWRRDHPDAVIVARPSKWGNPFTAKSAAGAGYSDPRKMVVQAFRDWLNGNPWACGCLNDYETQRQIIHENIHELRGKDLACWCPLDQPCHADVLLEIANG